MKAWKVQKFFGDVAYDLRSRGLLPVVGLLLVAMIAVPILVSRGSKANSNASLAPTANLAQSAPENERAVVSYSPGIRNYKKRLNDLTAKDPFHKEFSHSAATASALTSTVSIPSSSTGASSGASSTGSATLPSPVGGPSGPSGSGGHKKKKKKSNSGPITYQVNLLAGDVNTTLTPFNDVQAMTPLPAQTTPVVIYFGLSSDNANALFLVSNKVSTVTGPGTCVPSPDDCALLTLPVGQSEDLLYSGDGKTYRIVVAQIKPSR
jgi:hypothetical protein